MPAPFKFIQFVAPLAHEVTSILVAAADYFSPCRSGSRKKRWNLAGQRRRLIVEEDTGARYITIQTEERIGSHGPAAVTGLCARYAVS